MKESFYLPPKIPRKITKLVIHCSDSPNGRDDDIYDIDNWHADPKFGFERNEHKRKKWRPDLFSVGYHYVINVQGDIQQGRYVDEHGAHAYPENAHSLGVCMVGRDQFEIEQWVALKNLVISLRNQYPDLEVVGHHSINQDKTCPNFDVVSWIENGMNPAPNHIRPRLGA